MYIIIGRQQNVLKHGLNGKNDYDSKMGSDNIVADGEQPCHP